MVENVGRPGSFSNTAFGFDAVNRNLTTHSPLQNYGRLGSCLPFRKKKTCKPPTDKTHWGRSKRFESCEDDVVILALAHGACRDGSGAARPRLCTPAEEVACRSGCCCKNDTGLPNRLVDAMNRCIYNRWPQNARARYRSRQKVGHRNYEQSSIGTQACSLQPWDLSHIDEAISMKL